MSLPTVIKVTAEHIAAAEKSRSVGIGTPIHFAMMDAYPAVPVDVHGNWMHACGTPEGCFDTDLPWEAVESQIAFLDREEVKPFEFTVRWERARDGMDHVMFRLEITHRSDLIHKRLQQRSAYRRRRRSANLRYRAPRWRNRARVNGWLAPSLWSRVQHVESWARRIQRWCPLTVVDLELVRFDTQLMQNPEISGTEYQQGTLAGYEAREYLLAKFGRKCVYCDAENVPLNIDHVVPRSRGGSNKITNLVLACVRCNQDKGNRLVQEFCPARATTILAQAKAPQRDAAAVNSTRFATLAALKDLGMPVECSTGGRTKFNRHEYGIPKTHTLDAACIGVMIGIASWDGPTLTVKATGRGTHKRTCPDAYGFPRSRMPRSKRVHGFATGDLVAADVPSGKSAGHHIGRVVVRLRGSFRIGAHDNIRYYRCRILQRSDGYNYTTQPTRKER